MPTIVGKQKTEAGVLTQAVKLEMDCVAAYHQAAVSIKARGMADAFENAESDCKKHIDAWQEQLRTLGKEPASCNPMSEPANRFKIKLAALFGVRGIHRALRNNPVDCATAYERVANRADLRPATRALARRFQPDAAKHAHLVDTLVGEPGMAQAR